MSLHRVTTRFRQGAYTLRVQDSVGLEAEVLGRIVECWRASYARMARRFNPQAPRSVHLHIDPGYGGAAEALGNRITMSAAHIQSHPWDCDVMTHEQFHVVQSYADNEAPGWAVEGLADYARFRYGLYNAQVGWSLPEFSPSQSYTDSYRVTARFFVWLEERGSFLEDLDARLRDGAYRHGFWEERFGQGVDKLWSDYASDPALSIS